MTLQCLFCSTKTSSFCLFPLSANSVISNEVLYAQVLTGYFGYMDYIYLSVAFVSPYAVWSCKDLNFQCTFLLNSAQFFFLPSFFVPKAFCSIHRTVNLFMQSTFWALKRFLFFWLSHNASRDVEHSLSVSKQLGIQANYFASGKVSSYMLSSSFHLVLFTPRDVWLSLSISIVFPVYF